MREFDRLVGDWHGEGEVPVDPPLTVTADAAIERLGELIVFRSVAQPREVPDSLSIIGGAPEGEPQPMHYFEFARGQTSLPHEPRRVDLDDLAGPNARLERPQRPGPQPALHRRDLGRRADDRGPLGERHGRCRGREGPRLPDHLRAQVAPSHSQQGFAEDPGDAHVADASARRPIGQIADLMSGGMARGYGWNATRFATTPCQPVSLARPRHRPAT